VIYVIKTKEAKLLNMKMGICKMKKLFINSLLVFIIFLFCGFSSFSQVKFYAITDVSKVEKGKIFQISYVLEDAEIKDIILPEFTNFEVLGSPSRSNEMSVINSVSKSKMTYTYKINPLKIGKHKIGSAKLITANNKKLISNELTIEVLGSSLNNRIKPRKNTNFFIITEVSDKSLYPGQQALLKYKLYTIERPAGIRNEYIPDFKGFKNIPIEYEFPTSTEKINNITYYVYTISSFALFALKQGNFKYEPAKFFIEIPDGNSQDIFFQTIKSYSLRSEPIEFKVSPLPPNPPKDYSGIVGIVNITSDLKKQSVSDEVYVFTLNIESDCEKNSLTAPDIKDIFPDFEIFDPKLVSMEELFHSGKLMVRKSFEYIFVPKKAGIYDISMPFVYFNTEENNYVKFKTKSEKIEIKASSIKKNSFTTNNDVSEIEPFKKNIKVKKNTKPLFFTFSYCLLLISLLLIFPLLYYFKLQNDKQKKIDPIVAKNLKAKVNADKKLNKALKLMKENKEHEFYNEIYSVLISYAADKFKLTNYESNKENIKLKLSESGLSDETISEYIDLVNKAEMYVYSGHSISGMNELYTKTSEILNHTHKFV
jgi:hypothetical protein